MISKYLPTAIIAMVMMITTACSTSLPSTRANNYPEMYNARPATIVLMPPINKTMNVEAKDYFYNSMAAPLCEAGYYVVSPYLAYNLFKSESAYDSEMFIEGNNLEVISNVFDADAIMFTIINKWEKSKIGGYVNVNVEYILKSPKNNKAIFQRTGDITINTNVDAGGGLLGALVSAAVTAATTTDYTQMNAARSCSHYIFKDIPRGKYSSDNGKDGEFKAENSSVRVTLKQ